MEFNEKRYIYLYGKFYDNSKEITPNKDSDYDLMIHWNLKDENKTISSLEGLFITNKPLADEVKKGIVNSDWFPIVRRNQMKLFEEKYQGKFIPFEK